jgi:hypothetical protein
MQINCQILSSIATSSWTTGSSCPSPTRCSSTMDTKLLPSNNQKRNIGPRNEGKFHRHWRESQSRTIDLRCAARYTRFGEARVFNYQKTQITHISLNSNGEFFCSVGSSSEQTYAYHHLETISSWSKPTTSLKWELRSSSPKTTNEAVGK